MKIGYFLSCEEWGPKDLISQAVKAQEAGFEGLWISDHYRPWNDEQGHSFGRDEQSAPAHVAPLWPNEGLPGELAAGSAHAGSDELYVNQFGPDQDAFFTAYLHDVIPRLR